MKKITILILTIILLLSCANRGQGPQGGRKDEIPPKYVKSTPHLNATNVSKKRIEIEFDENINLKEIVKNVMVSPPQKKQPIIKSYLKKVVAELEDTLLKNTTYTLDFGNAIVDNNEGNVLEGFVMSFSTGEKLDTMQLSGTVIDSENLNPIPNVVVGIHEDTTYNAFLKKPFLRISKTDSKGKFTIYNAKKSKYRVYALNDLNRDNMLNRGEGVAFNKSVYQTTTQDYIRQDTIWKDSTTVDTVKSVETFRYLPNNIILKYFKDNTKREYLAKHERAVPNKISLYFNTKTKNTPNISGLNIEWKSVLTEVNPTKDTIHYWLTDSVLIKKDTIKLRVEYQKSDSAFNLQNQIDTISFINKKVIESKTDKPNKLLDYKTNISGQFDIYKSIDIAAQTPILRIDSSKIRLFEKVDTVEKQVQFTILKTDSVGRKYSLKHSWKSEGKYELKLDSLALIDVYGAVNDSAKYSISVRSVESYAILKVSLATYDSIAIIQLLNNKDEIVRENRLKPNGTIFRYLEPGEYYIRYYIDQNMNGKWDGGNYFNNQQPEEVYYYSKKLELMANWEYDEVVDVSKTPLLLQKPKELLKDDGTKSKN